jgi:hypothetical protein
MSKVRLLDDGGEPSRIQGHSGTPRSAIHTRRSGHWLEQVKEILASKIGYLRKKGLLAGALAISAVLAWFLVPFGKDAALADLLGDQGYWETVPPAEYYLPGSINTIEVRSDGRIAIHPTCKIDAELLNKYTLRSRTIDRTLAERLSKGFDVTDRMEGLLPIEMKAHKAKKLVMSLQNSSILQISDEELFSIRKEIIKDTCQEAIEWNLNNGATVCQTRAALKGDLVYNIVYENDEWNRERSTGPSIGVERNERDTNQIVGKGLIYGVSFAPRAIISESLDCRIGLRKKA